MFIPTDVEPFYFSKRSDDYFEIIISFCGTMESTGGLLQVETSYLNTEILYGKRLVIIKFLCVVCICY